MSKNIHLKVRELETQDDKYLDIIELLISLKDPKSTKPQKS